MSPDNKPTMAEQTIDDLGKMILSMKVSTPPREFHGASIERFTLTDDEVLRAMVYNGPRNYTAPGEYTKLMINGKLWMSDTFSERVDHIPFIQHCRDENAETVLVTGLGLGMVIFGLIKNVPTLKEIVVIENNPRVIELSSQYLQNFGSSHNVEISVIWADARENPTTHLQGYYFDAAWHDIWISICEDNDWEEIKDLYDPWMNYEKGSSPFQMCWGENEFNSEETDGFLGYAREIMDMTFDNPVIEGEVESLRTRRYRLS